MYKWEDLDDVAIDYLEKLTGEKISEMNEYRKDIFLMQYNNVISNYFKNKNADNKTEDKQTQEAQTETSEEAQETDTKKDLEEKKKTLAEVETKEIASQEKLDEETKSNETKTSKKIPTLKDKDIEDEPELQQNQNQETTVKTLTLAEIDQQLAQQETYWDEKDDNYRDSEGFAILHEDAIKTIEQFVEGKIELEGNAYEKMSEYIRIFIDDYQTDPHKTTHDKAVEKLNKLKEEKNKKLREIIESVSQQHTNSQENVGGAAVLDDTKSDNSETMVVEETTPKNNEQENVDEAAVLDSVKGDDIETMIVDENILEAGVQENVVKKETLEKVEEQRIRSNDNFDNDVEMRKIELEVLFSRAFKDKELISEEDYKKAKDILSRIALVEDVAGKPETKTQNYATAEEIAQAYEIIDTAEDKIAQKDEDLFHQVLSNMVVERYISSNREKDSLVSPEILATAIDGYNRQLKQNKFENDEQRKQVEHKLEVAVHYAKTQIYDLAEKQNYFFVDITNASDIYSGYEHAIKVCREYDEAKAKEAEKQAGKEEAEKIKSNNEAVNKIYDQAQKMLDEYIKPYDELYNIPAKTDNPVKAENIAIDINDNIRFYDEVIDKMEFNEASLGEDGHEFLKTLKNFKIVSSYDENGQAVYEQCIEEKDGKLSVVKGSSLEAILRSAALDEAMKKLNGKVNKKEAQKELMEAVKTNAYETLMAYEQAEKTIKAGLGEEINKFTDPKYAEEFRAKLQQQEVAISPLAMDLAIKRNATKVEAYGNRLKQNLGANATSFIRASLKDQLIKLDSRLSDENKEKYGNNAKAVRRAGLKRAWVGCAVSSVVAFGASYGIAKLSGKAATAAALARNVAGASPGVMAELSVGGLNALAGAAAGAAISTIAYLGTKKISAMIKGQKYTWKDVKNEFKDPKTYAIIATGALSGASVGFALSGCPQCATCCGVAAFGAAAVAKFIGPYKNLRASGHKRSVAALNAIAIAAVTTTAGLSGHRLGTHGLQAQETNVTIDKDKAQELIGKTNEELAKQGISREEVTLPSDQLPQGEGWVKTGDNEAELLAIDGPRAYNRISRWLEPDVLKDLMANCKENGLDDNQASILINKIMIHSKNIPDECTQTVTNATQNVAYNDYTSQTGVSSVTKEADPYLIIDAYKEKYGVSDETVQRIANLIDWKNHTINFNDAEAVNLANAQPMSSDGALRNVDLGNNGTPHMNAGLPANAVHDAEGHLAGLDQGATGESVFSSWHDFANRAVNSWAKFTQTFSQKPFAAMGTLIVELAHKEKSKLRSGALADRVEQTKKKDNPKPTPPKLEPIDEWLIEEYKIIHGIKPNEAEYIRYKGLVTKEHQHEVEKGITDKSFSKEYFEDRMAQFNEKLQVSISPMADPESKEFQNDKANRISSRRQEALTAVGFTKEGENLEYKNFTLRDFERVAEIKEDTPQHAALKAAHGVEKAQTADGKRDKPRNGVFNLDNKTTSGNNQNNGKGVNDGKVDLKANTAKLKRSGRGC